MTSFHFIACLFILGNLSKIYGTTVCSPNDDLLSNPLSCTSFYQCANGFPILMQCASSPEIDLVFNPILKQCVNVSDYPCRINVDPPTLPPTLPSTLSQVTCNHGDDILPNPTDCNSFYRCVNGVPLLFLCAPNREGESPLVFDPNLGYCVHQSDYSCFLTLQPALPPILPPTSPQVNCNPGDDLLPNPANCNSFYQCANGVPVLFQCAANREGEPPLVFDPNLKYCVYQSDYSCYPL